MFLNLIYITNDPAVALVAQDNGVERVMVDLETLGKEERQKNINSVKSHHTLGDVAAVARVLDRSELLVRVNPWHEDSPAEVEAVIAAGAKNIMLPMWKTPEEVDTFLRCVNRRTRTVLLLETREAMACVDRVLEHPMLEEIHIGLNDLHLSLGKTFMFELLVDGTVEALCEKFRAKGVPYGIGGIAKLRKGLVPAANVIMEHYRLGSRGAILSRTFCNAEEIGDLEAVKALFREQMELIRNFEASLPALPEEAFPENRREVERFVEETVELIRKRRAEAN